MLALFFQSSTTVEDKKQRAKIWCFRKRFANVGVDAFVPLKLSETLSKRLPDSGIPLVRQEVRSRDSAIAKHPEVYAMRETPTLLSTGPVPMSVLA